MAFSNYADLKTAVASWLNREDQEVKDRIPDFIHFGENSLFRGLRVRANEVDLTYLATSGNNVLGVALPDDFLEVKLVTYDQRKVERKSDQWLLEQDPTAAGGPPLYFVRIGNILQFWRVPDSNENVRLIYYQQQAHISDQNIPTMYLKAPEIYLWGALLEAEPFLKHKDKAPIWETKREKVFSELMDESWSEEYSGSTVAVASAYNDSNRNSSRVVGGL